VTRRAEVVALLVVLAVGAALRLARPGADVPARAETTDAPIQDALWYLEAATGPAEGLPRDLEPLPAYDPPVVVHTARVWLALTGVSLGALQGFGALASLATLLLVWRLVRAVFGPIEALAAAAVLATLYPFVALARTTLVYGFGALALTVAAALGWAAGRRPPRDRAWLEVAAWFALALALSAVLDLSQATRPTWWGATAALVIAFAVWAALRRARPEAAWQVCLGAASWAVVLASTLALRPPLAALAGGLALVHVTRAKRPQRALTTLGLVGLLAAVTLWIADPGQLRAQTADRLARYVSADALTPAGFTHRLLRLGGELRGLTGSGYLSLVGPGVALATALGGLAVIARRRLLAPAARDLAVIACGWVGLFALSAAAIDYRPLRYFTVVAPPLAIFAGVGVGSLLRPAGERPSRRAAPLELLLGALWGALVAPHCLELLAGPRPLDDLLAAAAAGGAATVGVLTIDPVARASRALRLGLGALVLAGALAGAIPCALDLERPSWTTLAANRAAGLALGPRASVVGPHASVLALGHGLTRRRAPWIDGSAERIDATVARLRDVKATHLALGIQQARSSGLLEALAAHGEEATLVGIFDPRGTPVLLLRLHGWESTGYELSAFERRRLSESDPAPEGNGDLLLARVRALAFEGEPTRALDLARRSLDPEQSRDALFMTSLRAAIAGSGRR
jgi:hypothetical protein